MMKAAPEQGSLEQSSLEQGSLEQNSSEQSFNQKFSYGDKDPIAALATGFVSTNKNGSALAVIRTSGGEKFGNNGEKSVIDLFSKIFSRPSQLEKSNGNFVVHGWIVSEKKKIDEVIVSVFRAPHSYTGEDSVEISCHGGRTTVKEIMSILKKTGFREALPGEFTFRAFMNGKLDLTRAESVMEIVSAKTARARELAVRRLSGFLEKEITALKNQLVNALASVEILLDYPEDELENKGDESETFPCKNQVQLVLSTLKKLSALWKKERIYSEGIFVVIAGKPNAGKSSLFNCLIREDRSIVTEIPGTTRDWIEAQIDFDGIPVRLADTAGLRENSAAEKINEAERIGINKSAELIEKADMVLYIIDGTGGTTASDRDFIFSQKEKPLLVLWNKADLAPLPETEKAEKFCAVSAKTGQGMDELINSIVSFLESKTSDKNFDPNTGDMTGLGSERQKELIEVCISSLEEALLLAEKNEPLDLIAPFLREGINSLGEITGEISTVDILETMFSEFCVGK